MAGDLRRLPRRAPRRGARPGDRHARCSPPCHRSALGQRQQLSADKADGNGVLATVGLSVHQIARPPRQRMAATGVAVEGGLLWRAPGPQAGRGRRGDGHWRRAPRDRVCGAGRAGVSRTVRRTARRGSSSPVTLLIPSDATTEADDLSAPAGDMAPLARASALVHMLEMAGGSLRVHPNDDTSLFALLPRDDARWVVETEADAVVPVPGSRRGTVGALVVGRRFDGRIVRSVDIPFLEDRRTSHGGRVGLAVEKPGVKRHPAVNQKSSGEARSASGGLQWLVGAGHDQPCLWHSRRKRNLADTTTCAREDRRP